MASGAEADARLLFVFGLGYTGLGLVRQLQRQGGWRCVGTCRTPEKVATLAQSGVGAHVYDPDNLHVLGSDALQDLSASTHILSTIAPNADFDRDPVRVKSSPAALCSPCLAALRAQHPPAPLGSFGHICVRGAHFEGKEHTAEPRYSSPARQVLLGHLRELAGLAAGGRVRWAGYVSSTSVYGDWGGAWVDERCGLPVRTRPPSAAATESCLAVHMRWTGYASSTMKHLHQQ